MMLLRVVECAAGHEPVRWMTDGTEPCFVCGQPGGAVRTRVK